jgi:RNA polymerase sigma-70 factor, ECF subfamily
MARERAGHTLQTTALVNEAYLRLVDAQAVRWNDRAHFFGIAARLMRRVLMDHARQRAFQKRGGGMQAVSLDDAMFVSRAPDVELFYLVRRWRQFAIHDADARMRRTSTASWCRRVEQFPLESGGR